MLKAKKWIQSNKLLTICYGLELVLFIVAAHVLYQRSIEITATFTPHEVEMIKGNFKGIFGAIACLVMAIGILPMMYVYHVVLRFFTRYEVREMKKKYEDVVSGDKEVSHA